MTLAEFRKLKLRDFDNGAVRDEIEIVIEQRDALLAACEYAAGSFAQVPSDKTVPPIVLHDCKDKLDAAIKKTRGK